MALRFIFLTLFLIEISIYKSQLNTQDKEIILKILNQNQSENGLFNFSFDNTLKAIKILKHLGKEVSFKPKICSAIKEVKESNITIYEIDKELKCQIHLPNLKINESELKSEKISQFLNKVKYADEAKAEVNWVEIYKSINAFLSKNKFSGKSEAKTKTIHATAIGIEILGIIYDHVGEAKKNEIKENLSLIFNALQSAIQDESSESSIFLEKYSTIYALNYQILKALKITEQIKTFPQYENLRYRLFNYFTKYKYEAFNIEGAFYLLEILNMLKDIPIISLEKKILEYNDNNKVSVSFIDGLGNPIKISNGTLTYQVEKISDKKIKINNYDDDKYDYKGGKKKNIQIESQDKVNILLGDFIKTTGLYKIDFTLTNKKKKLNIKKTENLKLISNIQFKNLKFKIDNTVDPSLKESEIHLNYPSVSHRNFQANQDSIFVLSVQIESEDQSIGQLDQIFLQLKHMETGKIYSSYASKYNKDKKIYSTNFLIDDPSNMESYNGEYEVSVIACSPFIKAPLKWDFCSIKINFRKPMDTSYEEDYKNVMKPKMLPTFTHEMKLSPNYGFSFIFCSLISLSFLGLLHIISKNNANLNNLPSKSKFLYCFLMLILLGFVALLLVLFWIKLNLVQTLGIISLLSIPGVFIVYNAMKSIKIDI